MGILFLLLDEAVKPETASGAPIGYTAALLAAVVALFAACITLLKYISKLRDDYEKRIDEMWAARYEDLNKVSNKSSTVEDVTFKSIKDRKSKKEETDRKDKEDGDA